MIRISRKSAFAERMRAYKVILDGQEIGEIRNGETKEFETAAGKHSLNLKIDWCRSKILDFEDTGGAPVEFICSTNLRGLFILFGMLYVIFFRNNYIKLEQVSGVPA